MKRYLALGNRFLSFLLLSIGLRGNLHRESKKAKENRFTPDSNDSICLAALFEPPTLKLRMVVVQLIIILLL